VSAVLPGQAEELGTLPVLLADGRVVRGTRGTVVLDDALAGRICPATVATLGRWGVRLVDPADAHPVLERLGAVVLDVPGLLASPQVREAILSRQDDPGGDGLGEVARAVVDLVALDQDLRATGDLRGAGDLPGHGPDPAPPVLGMVELPAADGEPVPAHGLVLPGSLAHRLFDDRVMAPVGAAVAGQVSEPVLRALGVRSAPVAVRVPDVIADPGADDPDGTDDATLPALSLDGWDDYLAWLADRLGPGAWVGDVRCVADLDAVAADAWPQMLAVVAGDRDLRAALLGPVLAPEGSAASYSAWWLTHRAGLGLGAPFALRPDVLPGWLPGPPAVLDGTDEQVRRVLGGVGGPDELGLPGWAQVLDACQVGEPVDLPRAVEVWRALAALAQAPGAPGAHPPDPPRVLPALVGPTRAALVRTESVVVADAPMWSQRTDLGAVLPVPSAAAEALAGLLAVPLASELASGQVDGPGETEPVPDQVLALAGAVTSWQVHDELAVDGSDVDWWVDADGTVHAVHLAGLAAALAQANDRWPDRWAIEAALTDPARAPEAQLDQAFTV